MGMFDYVTCRAPLPTGYESMQGRFFQTKDLANEMLNYTIAEDGSVTVVCHEYEWVEDESILGGYLNPIRTWTETALEDYHGDLFFYGFREERNAKSDLITFRARYTEGKLMAISVLLIEPSIFAQHIEEEANK